MANFKIETSFYPSITIISRMSLDLSESYAESICLLTKLEDQDAEGTYSSTKENDALSTCLTSAPAFEPSHDNATVAFDRPAYNPIHPVDNKSILTKRSSLVIEELQLRTSIMAAQVHNHFYGNILRGSETGRIESHSRAQILQEVNQREGNRSTIRYFRLSISSLLYDFMRQSTNKQYLSEVDGLEIKPLVDTQRSVHSLDRSS